MPQPVNASVIICTYRRPEMLAGCLASLAAQANPYGRWEVVVVDNDPDGGASTTVAQAASLPGLPDLRYEHEPALGLSNARNRGIVAARGDVVAFIDDDALAQEGWLAALLEPFSRDGLAVDIVGGEVDPDFGPGGRPDWLLDQYLHHYSARLGWDTVERELTTDEWVMEGNSAIRRRWFAHAGFDPNLGRRGELMLCNEGQILMMFREKLGARAYFKPTARITHIIHADRLTKRWLCKRIFYQGVSDALLHKSRGQLKLPDTLVVDVGGLRLIDFDKLDAGNLPDLEKVLHAMGYAAAYLGLL